MALTLNSRFGQILFLLAGIYATNADPLLIWSEEFNSPGSPDFRSWNYENGYVRNDEVQYYTSRPENARVQDGVLIIEARQDNWNGNPVTSASLITKGKRSWRYGKIDVRAHFEVARGTWPAIWMLPENTPYGNWPHGGEIDIMENVGFAPNTVWGSLHTSRRNHLSGNGIGQSYTAPDLYVGWNIYSMLWSPDSIVIMINDIPYTRYANPGNWQDWPFDQRFYLILNMAIGGSWGGQQGVDYEALPKRMLVDYVRVYKVNFGGGPYPINLSAEGQGRVAKQPDMPLYPALTPVVITAIPDAGMRFSRWSDGSRSNPDTIWADHAVNLKAIFIPEGELIEQSSFPYTLGRWWLWKDNAVSATAFVEQGRGCVQVNTPGTYPWQAQFDYGDFVVSAGDTLEISFLAQSDQTNLSVETHVHQNHLPNEALSTFRSFTVNKTWTRYSGRLAVTRSDSAARLEFGVGHNAGKLCLDSISLRKINHPPTTAINGITAQNPARRAVLRATPRGILISAPNGRRYDLSGKKLH